MSIVSKNSGIVAICVGTLVTSIAILRANDGAKAEQKRRAIQTLEAALGGERPAGFTTNHTNATLSTIQLDDICELRFLKADLERANEYLKQLVDRRDKASDDPGSFKAELSGRLVREWELDVNFQKKAIAEWYDRHREEAKALERIGDKQAAEQKRQEIAVLMALGSEIPMSVSAFPAGPWAFGRSGVYIQPGRGFAIQQRQAESSHSKEILRRLVADQQRLVAGQQTREAQILKTLISYRQFWTKEREAAIWNMDEAHTMPSSRAGVSSEVAQNSNTGATESTGTDPDGAVTAPGATSDSTTQANELDLNQVLTELRDQVHELRKEVWQLRELLEKKP